MIKLFILDIDGCITHPFETPHWESITKIRELNRRSRTDEQIPALTLCTGRPLPYAEAVAQWLDIRLPFIFESAAMYLPEHNRIVTGIASGSPGNTKGTEGPNDTSKIKGTDDSSSTDKSKDTKEAKSASGTSDAKNASEANDPGDPKNADNSSDPGNPNDTNKTNDASEATPPGDNRDGQLASDSGKSYDTVNGASLEPIRQIKKWLTESVLPGYPDTMLEFTKMTDAGVVSNNRQQIDRIYKQILDHTRNHYPDLEVYRTDISVNTLLPGNHKGKGVELLSRELEVPFSRIAYIGDSEGDLKPLGKAKMAFAPANAIDRVKQVAEVIPMETSQAVFEAYRKIIEINKKRK